MSKKIPILSVCDSENRIPIHGICEKSADSHALAVGERTGARP